MNFIIMGYARYGKDTSADFLCETYPFLSTKGSSAVANDVFIYSALKDKYGYSSPEECFSDRYNHRGEWFDLICKYNERDPSRLGREIFKNYNIYSGIRSRREFFSLKNQQMFDASIWIDRSKILPPEPNNSMDIEPWMADYWIDNNGTIDDLHRNLLELMDTLLYGRDEME